MVAINNEKYCSNIKDKLARLVAEVRMDSKANLHASNIHAESFFREFLNTLFDWNLTNANASNPNAEGIDLYKVHQGYFNREIQTVDGVSFPCGVGFIWDLTVKSRWYRHHNGFIPKNRFGWLRPIRITDKALTLPNPTTDESKLDDEDYLKEIGATEEGKSTDDPK